MNLRQRECPCQTIWSDQAIRRGIKGAQLSLITGCTKDNFYDSAQPSVDVSPTVQGLLADEFAV